MGCTTQSRKFWSFFWSVVEEDMKSGAVMGVLALAAMVASGCVSSSKYEQAMADTQEAKEKAERVQLQKKALEDEVKSLRDQKSKLTSDAELASAELQRLNDSLDKERGGKDSRMRDLDQRSRDLAAQNRALKQVNDSLKKQNDSLKATVTKYQRAIKEPPASPMAVPMPPAAPVAPVPTSAPADPAAAGLVNVNTALSKQLEMLGLTQEEAAKVVAGRPYKVKQELVLRGILPKPKLDAIKDRITASQ